MPPVLPQLAPAVHLLLGQATENLEVENLGGIGDMTSIINNRYDACSLFIFGLVISVFPSIWLIIN